MISRNKPTGSTCNPVSLEDFFSNGDKKICVIEKCVQRPYVWDYRNIKDSVIEIKDAFLKTKETDDECYVNQGESVIAPLQNHNEEKFEEYKGKVFSLVDGSQRSRTDICIILASKFYTMDEDTYSADNLLDNIRYKNYYKLQEAGCNSLGDLYSFIKKNTYSAIKKEIQAYDAEKKLNDTTEKHLSDVFKLCYKLIEDNIPSEDAKDFSTFILKNVFLYQLQVTKEEKIEKFIDCNHKGTPMSTEDLFTRKIMNLFPEDRQREIEEAYDRSKKAENDCIKRNVWVNTKSGCGLYEFAMKEVMKMKIGEKKVFRTNYELNDIKYGIDACYNEQIYFTNVEQGIEYFDAIYDYITFISNSMNFNKESFFRSYFYFRNPYGKRALWWDLITPCYISDRMLNEKFAKYLIEEMFRMFSLYIVQRRVTGNTNVQDIMNAFGNLAYISLRYKDERDTFKREVSDCVSDYIYKHKPDSFDSKIGILRYDISQHRGAIEMIFKSLEYNLITKADFLGKENFYDWFVSTKGNSPEIDHLVPQHIMNTEIDEDEKVSLYNGLGNLFILEKSLNTSKQDSLDKNEECYKASKFYITLLLNKDIVTGYSKEQMKKIREIDTVEISPEKMKAPSEDDIKYLKKRIISDYIKFINEYQELDIEEA